MNCNMKWSITVIALVVVTDMKAQQQFNTSLLYPDFKKLEQVAVVRPKPEGLAPAKPAVDLSLLLPPPGMQGHTQGSCSAWAVAYGLMTYLKERQIRWTIVSAGSQLDKSRVYSPAFIYNALCSDNSCRVGITLPETLDYCKNTGVLPLSQFAYDPDRCDRKPTPAEKLLASKNTILSYNRVFDIWEGGQPPYIDTSYVIAQLNDSLPVVIGVQLDSDFKNYNLHFHTSSVNAKPIYVWDKFIADCPYRQMGCYHAMLVVGYDQSISAFKIMNSWDQTFGTSGYIWVSYDVFRQAVKEAYVASLPPLNANLVRPTAGLPPPETNKFGFFEGYTIDTNWIKKGYYRQYGNIRVGCQYLNAADGIVVLQLYDAKDDMVITSAVFKPGDDYQIFGYKGIEIKLKALYIKHAGRNPLKKAVFYSVAYVNDATE